MKNILFILPLCAILINSCSSNSIQDGDGNSYETTMIGSQTWLAKNLSTTTFRNGDIIVQSSTSEEWLDNIERKIPSWCYYEFDKKNGSIYGKIYNYYAVIDSRNLAPDGFKIPKHEDWEQLIATTQCEKCGNSFLNFIPEGSTTWEKMDDDESNVGTNETGFSALAGGSLSARTRSEIFYGLGHETGWWSISNGYPNTTHNNWTNIRSFSMRSHHLLYGSNQSDDEAFYVRCVK